MENNKPILTIINLRKFFPVTKGVFSKTIGYVKAVDDVSFDLKSQETLGLVGESGCGKTTLGRTILLLLKPSAGEIYFKNSPNLSMLSNKQSKPYRKFMQMIFQDPFSSLNPRMTVGSIVAEALTIHKLAKRKEKWEKVAKILESVGLNPEHIKRFPHEFSGGQRQRIGIARAIAVQPEIIVADEPVSALDVSIQAQIINLLISLQEKMGLSYIFISHDLSLIGYIAHRVAVMYLGKIVEFGKKNEVFSNPLHPYTKALMAAVPLPDPKTRSRKIFLEGDVPSPINPPSGCYFHPRCKYKMAQCSEMTPQFIEINKDHKVSCFLFNADKS